MSGIRLSQYIDQAKLSRDGDIRLDAKTEKELVNKGTLGNRVATWLKMGDEGTREHRSNEALKGFVEALQQEYGEDYALRALKEEGIVGTNGQLRKSVLTGRDILNTIDNISGKGGYIERDTKLRRLQLDEAVEAAMQRHGLTGKSVALLRLRLENEVNTLIAQGREWPRGLTESVALEIKGLVDRGELEESIEMRAQLDRGLRRLIANPSSDPQEMLDSLLAITRDIESIARVEGPNRLGLKLDVALDRAIRRLTRHHFDTMLEALGKFLHPSSGLRALYCAAEKIAKQDGSRLHPKQQSEALMRGCEMLIRALGRGDWKPMTSTVEDDVRILGERTDLDEPSLQRGEGVVRSWLDETAPPPPSGLKDRFLPWLKATLEVEGPDIFRGGGRVALVQSIERELSLLEGETLWPRRECIAQFRDFVRAGGFGDIRNPPDLPDEILRILGQLAPDRPEG